MKLKVKFAKFFIKLPLKIVALSVITFFNYVQNFVTLYYLIVVDEFIFLPIYIEKIEENVKIQRLHKITITNKYR